MFFRVFVPSGSEKAECDPSVWRTSSPDQCDDSPCDFCCTSHEMMAAGGICPVLTCDDGIASLGMDEIWPMGDTHVETIFYNMIALLVLMHLAMYFRQSTRFFVSPP